MPAQEAAGRRDESPHACLKEAAERSPSKGRRQDCGGRVTRPLEPEFKAAQRARIIFGYQEAGERQEASDTGWARLDGPWVQWHSDMGDRWTTWSAHAVLCIDWESE